MQETEFEMIQSPVIDLMRSHRSIRAFKPDPVPDEMIRTVVQTAQWAPSSCFRQVYSVIAVRNPEAKHELRLLCSNQKWVEECPVFLAFCLDFNRLEDICTRREKPVNVNLEYTETFLMAVIDVALFMQNAALAAESLGLGTVMIGGLRNQPREVIRLLKLPKGVFGISGMCLGFPETIPAQQPRLPMDEVLHWEQYDSTGRTERLAAYDESIRAARVYIKKDGNPNGWTNVMGRTTSKPPADEGRLQIRQILLEQGFELK